MVRKAKNKYANYISNGLASVIRGIQTEGQGIAEAWESLGL